MASRGMGARVGRCIWRMYSPSVLRVVLREMGAGGAARFWGLKSFLGKVGEIFLVFFSCAARGVSFYCFE